MASHQMLRILTVDPFRRVGELTNKALGVKKSNMRRRYQQHSFTSKKWGFCPTGIGIRITVIKTKNIYCIYIIYSI